MISDHIHDLIIAAKELPNGLHRNKIVSHLEDALAHARVMELYQKEIVIDKDSTTALLKTFMGLGKDGVCICPDGAINSLCPVHGENIPRPV